MSFAGLDKGSIARSLAQIADREEDVAEVYLERLEEVELPEGGVGGLAVRREEGLAVRLTRDGSTWLAARDGLGRDRFADALRQVARALPAARYVVPELRPEPAEEPIEVAEVLAFPALVSKSIRRHHSAFPLRLTVRRHHRRIQVIGTRLVPEGESERFYSCRAELPWATFGAVLSDLDEAAAERLAGSLVALFRAREAPPPRAGRRQVVLAPAAAAVFLHEAVAHALETDTLVLGGRPEAAVGVRLGSDLLEVLDDPASAPRGVRRATDDEGIPVRRRWLLRQGRIAEPLADLFAARDSTGLTPGAARRSGRHHAPAPRSTHLELTAGAEETAELMTRADDGLYVPEASRGSLDPLTGDFSLRAPLAYRIHAGERAAPTGPLGLRGRVADLLGAVSGVGSERIAAGAGWCAKGGQRLAVWATTPALAIDGVEVVR